MVHGESCYYVANASSGSTLNSSRESCQNSGADLAVIKSEDEDRFVYDLLRNTIGNRSGWIGLYRKPNNKFYWLNDRPAEGDYQKWNKGEPNGGEGAKDCWHIIGGNYDGKWNDASCSIKGPVAICEWPI